MRKYLNIIKNKLINVMLLFRFSQRIVGRRWVSRWNKNYILAEKELDILPKILSEDSVVFDIGANRGEISYFLSNKCNVHKIYSFEPQNRMYGVLEGVASLIKKIVPIKIALSKDDTGGILNIPIKNSSRYTQEASIEKIEHSKSKKESVATDTVDNFILKNKIVRLDFIKCDTEGHELSIMTGAQKTLSLLRPIIFIEIKKSHKEELVDLIKSNGYRVYQKPGVISENYYFFPSERERIINDRIGLI